MFTNFQSGSLTLTAILVTEKLFNVHIQLTASLHIITKGVRQAENFGKVLHEIDVVAQLINRK